MASLGIRAYSTESKRIAGADKAGRSRRNALKSFIAQHYDEIEEAITQGLLSWKELHEFLVKEHHFTATLSGLQSGFYRERKRRTIPVNRPQTTQVVSEAPAPILNEQGRDEPTVVHEELYQPLESGFTEFTDTVTRGARQLKRIVKTHSIQIIDPDYPNLRAGESGYPFMPERLPRSDLDFISETSLVGNSKKKLADLPPRPVDPGIWVWNEPTEKWLEATGCVSSGMIDSNRLVQRYGKEILVDYGNEPVKDDFMRNLRDWSK